MSSRGEDKYGKEEHVKRHVVLMLSIPCPPYYLLVILQPDRITVP
jgi:hypothetical protein